SKVELRVSCKHLLDRDTLNKSDPCVVLLMQSQGQWMEVDRSEVIKSNLHPVFSKVFSVDYYFEEVQKLRFEVYDSHGHASLGTHDDDFLGGMECTVGQVLARRGRGSPLPRLAGSGQAGRALCVVLSEEISGNNGYVELAFRAKKLDDKVPVAFAPPPPSPRPRELWAKVHSGARPRCDVVKNNLSPVWEPFKVSLNSLCSCEEQRKLRGVVFDYDSRGKHDFIGEFYTTFEEMQKATGENKVQWDCMNPKYKLKKRNYKNSGVIILLDLKLHRVYSFLDYIMGGCQIHFTSFPGPDVTAGQRTPRAASSVVCPAAHVHYAHGLRGQQGLSQALSSDKKFSALGFGARIPPNYEQLRPAQLISHVILQGLCPVSPAARRCRPGPVARGGCAERLSKLPPSEMFGAVVQDSDPAGRDPSGSACQYYILLILTDGVVTDMADTREAIVRASYLPMSIIIVGVGNADFTDMQILDGDDGVLRSPKGEPVLRDIVQFVPFREFKNASATALAKCVLAEVPKQVVEYYSYKALPPRCPKAESPDSTLNSP
uniref:Copine 7 n=1 Tax=Pelodiscus sinensis TaxID=13735 RepID=K7GEN1_PELSI